MEYQVELSEQAQDDIAGAYAYISTEAPEAALRWRHGIQQKVNSLKTFPLRCGFAFEDRFVQENLHQTFYESYRILYVVRGQFMERLPIPTAKGVERSSIVELATQCLEYKLPPEDCERVIAHAAKAREGTPTSDEPAVLDEYERVTAFVEIMQSKARLSLKQADLSP